MDKSNCTLKTIDTDVTLLSENINTNITKPTPTTTTITTSNDNYSDDTIKKIDLDELEPIYMSTTVGINENNNNNHQKNSINQTTNNDDTTVNLLTNSNNNQQQTTNNDVQQVNFIIENEECGCCFLKFKNFQHWANIKLFVFFMCLIVMLTNALTVGYRNSVVTTIEKRFEISSIMSGVLSGSLEIGSLIATLFISYFFANRHIPRCIAISSLCCAIGSFMYSIPHFLSGSYTITNKVMNKTTNDLICRIDDIGISKYDHRSSLITSLINTNNCFQKQTNFLFFVLLIIANLLIGSSSAPLYTLGTTYIDNHVSKNNSSIYLSFMYSMLALGPVFGYLMGAAFLRIYVDVFQYSFKQIKLTVSDSGFIGAWWIGFVVLGFFIFVTSFPFFCFPKSIRKCRLKADATKYTLAENVQTAEQENAFGNLKTLPIAIKNIIANKVFLIVTFAFCCEITIISGFMTFLPKYIEHQYGLNNSVANIYTGGIAIPGAVMGILFGGFLVKRFQINPGGAAKMAIICNIICTVGIFVLIFVGCENIKMAGTTTSYEPKLNDSAANTSHSAINLLSGCNRGCHCTPNMIEPICGSDGITYFSPCYAGCKQYKKIEIQKSNNTTYEAQSLKGHSHTEQTQEKEQESFMSCSCITNVHNSEIYVAPTARSGACPLNCNALTPFLIILFLITLLTSVNQMPMIMVTLRSVTDIERPFALGLQLVIMRLLAYIPSPLIFGKAIDSTCLVWRQDECEQSGSCLFYDRELFRYIYGSIAALYKLLSTILFIGLYLVVRKYKFKSKPIEKLDNYISKSINSLNKS